MADTTEAEAPVESSRSTKPALPEAPQPRGVMHLLVVAVVFSVTHRPDEEAHVRLALADLDRRTQQGAMGEEGRGVVQE